MVGGELQKTAQPSVEPFDISRIWLHYNQLEAPNDQGGSMGGLISSLAFLVLIVCCPLEAQVGQTGACPAAH